MNRIVIALATVVALCNGCTSEQTEVETALVQRAPGFASFDTTIASRGTEIPATFVAPAGGQAETHPLVVLAHGHGGSRHEGGGFHQLAEALAVHGIASVRVDFPGCGDSAESFADNNLTNMLQDLTAARNWADARDDVDNERVGVLGYSMGGRLAVLLAAEDPSYDAMALWTPALENGAERNRLEFERLGGPGMYDQLKNQAAENGFAEYETRWGSKLQLGTRWFEDLEQTMPLNVIAGFGGPLLVLYGDADDVVPPATSEAAIAAATGSTEVVRHIVPTATHALGFYSHREEIAADVVEATASFFADRL